MNNISIQKITAVFFFLIITVNVYSQSRYLEDGISGSSFKATASFDEKGFSNAGISAAYSIGGIMDIGFRLKRGTGTIESYDRTDWNFDFLYNIVVLKQKEYIPLSLQLEGSYGFSNISSTYYDNEDIEYSGQGFQIGASLFREFNRKSIFSVLVGITASYRNFLFTQIDSTDPAATTTVTDRDETFLWGGTAGFSLKPENAPYFTLEVDVLYNQTDKEIQVEPAFLITSPKF